MSKQKVNWVAIGALATVISAIAGLIVSLEPFGKDPASTPEQATKEIVEILKIRATRILKTMDEQKKEALSSLKGGESSSIQPIIEDYLKELKDIRSAFVDLHNRHIDAVASGKFVLAHELLSDIYSLLSEYNVNGFRSHSGRMGGRVALYELDTAYPDSFYPGSLPLTNSKYVRDLIVKVWYGPKKNEDSASD